MYGLWSFTDWALVPETGPILRAAAPKSVGAAATKPAGGRRRILCAADGACARNEVDGRRELLWLTRRLAGSVGGVLGVIGRLPKWPERGAGGHKRQLQVAFRQFPFSFAQVCRGWSSSRLEGGSSVWTAMEKGIWKSNVSKRRFHT